MSLFRSLLIVSLVAVLGACGFKPLYGTRGTDNIIDDFSNIQVAPARDRIGQLYTNELKHLLNPLKEPKRPAYRLTSSITETTSSLAVKKSALATRANLNATVSYRLSVVQTGEQVFSGTNKITVGYNIYSADYATLAAEKDAQNRAIKELAQDTRLQLGAFFNNYLQNTKAQ